jgi:DNA-binding transcriptional LysR family regulator
LTESGAELLVYARRILQEVSEASNTMKALRGLQGGQLTIAAPPGLSVEPLTALIGAFRSLHPGVTFSLLGADDGNRAIDAVRSGRSEIGIVDHHIQTADVVSHFLRNNEIMLVSPPVDSPGTAFGITREELAGRPFIASHTGTRTRALLDEIRDSGVDIPIVVESPHREAVVPLVLAGVGSAFLTRDIAAQAARRGAIVQWMSPRITYAVHLIHLGSPLTRAGAAFVELAMRAQTSTDAPQI